MRASLRLATALAFVALAFVLSACGASTRAQTEHPKPAAPTTMTVAGAAFLTDNDVATDKLGHCILYGKDPLSCRTKKGWACSGTRLNSGIHTGTQVTVADASGKTVGLGSLLPGVITKSTSLADERFVCAFRFKVTDVPTVDDIYSLTVGDTPPLNFKKSDADTLVVMLSEGRIVGKSELQ